MTEEGWFYLGLAFALIVALALMTVALAAGRVQAQKNRRDARQERTRNWRRPDGPGEPLTRTLGPAQSARDYARMRNAAYDDDYMAFRARQSAQAPTDSYAEDLYRLATLNAFRAASDTETPRLIGKAPELAMGYGESFSTGGGFGSDTSFSTGSDCSPGGNSDSGSSGGSCSSD